MSAISKAVRKAADQGRPALVAYVTAGFPSKAGFLKQLEAISAVADVIEVGVPFSDPMADGTTIQRSSRVALDQGVSLRWILEQLASRREAASASVTPQAPVAASTTDANSGAGVSAGAPLLLMSYLNPLLSYGLEKLPADAAHAGVAGFIVPDLPYEECAELRAALNERDVALVQFVTPVTPLERMQMLCKASQGFIYAVTMTGTTGKNVATPQETLDYFDQVRKVSPVPVCAGFGIRSREQVERLTGHVDGVIVGSALVEVIERGEDPAAWLAALRDSTAR